MSNAVASADTALYAIEVLHQLAVFVLFLRLVVRFANLPTTTSCLLRRFLLRLFFLVHLSHERKARDRLVNLQLRLHRLRLLHLQSRRRLVQHRLLPSQRRGLLLHLRTLCVERASMLCQLDLCLRWTDRLRFWLRWEALSGRDLGVVEQFSKADQPVLVGIDLIEAIRDRTAGFRLHSLDRDLEALDEAQRAVFV